MLVNNFKQLLYFGNATNFKDVLGNPSSIICPAPDEAALNGHVTAGITRSFNYNSTAASNSYVSEQTSYTWIGVVNNQGGSATGSTQRNMNGFTIFVGTGDTAVTANDYKLDTPVTLDVLSASCIQNADGTIVVARTFQNNTGSDVVIKEKGLYIFMTRVNNSQIPVVMIGRKVLDTPVTIPDGGAYTFTTTIDMSQITFSEADN